MRLRFAIVISVFFLLYSTLLFNLYTIQIQDGELYSARAESQLQLSGLLEPVRGNIYFTDKDGGKVPAAINKEFPFVYAVPTEIDDAQEAARLVAPLIGKEVSILEKLFSRSDPYEPLLAKATNEQVSALRELALAGIYIELHPARFYPLEALGSHVVGFVSDYGSEDGRPIGQYGAERTFNDGLFGTPGTIEHDSIVRSRPGEHVTLTIDRNIQARGTEILKKVVADYRAESGLFIVEDTQTGKILAMGGVPDFNPNAYSAAPVGTFINGAVQKVYEPGSVFKVITMAAGIDAGKITPETTYYDAGEARLDGYTIKNWDLKSHGTITMTNVLERSVNTGTIFAERTMGHNIFLSYLKKFGFIEKTNIDLIGEVAGSLGELESKYVRDVHFATASFGQGISVTPLALINAISTIARGGMLMQPYVHTEERSRELRRVISKESARKVTDMMISAVDKARVAAIPGYTVAGKTGTAFIPDFNKGGYTDDVINTYVGFAPATNPRFAVLMRIDKPAGAPVAGLTVVPAFRELAEFILGYYNIAPDRLAE